MRVEAKTTGDRYIGRMESISCLGRNCAHFATEWLQVRKNGIILLRLIVESILLYRVYHNYSTIIFKRYEITSNVS